MDVLRSRIISKEVLEDDSCHVMYENIVARKHNEKMLDQIPGPRVVIKAIVTPNKRVKICPKTGSVDKTQFRAELELKIGAKVAMVYNVNTIDELVNGAQGRVVGIERNKKNEIYAVIVKFDQESTGKQQREDNKLLSDKYKDQNGTPIFKHSFEYNKTSYGKSATTYRANVLQFPLKLAWGLTSHSMQGLTTRRGTKLVCHWSNQFQAGMAYVMLGRTQDLEDILIDESSSKFDPSHIRAHPGALEESNRIHREFEALKKHKNELWDNHLSVSYMNVQRLRPHLEHVKADNLLMKSDILSLAETWLDGQENVELEGFGFGSFLNAGPGKGKSDLKKYFSMEESK